MKKAERISRCILPLSDKAKCAPYPQVLKRTVCTIYWYVVTILPIADLVLQLSCVRFVPSFAKGLDLTRTIKSKSQKSARQRQLSINCPANKNLPSSTPRVAGKIQPLAPFTRIFNIFSPALKIFHTHQYVLASLVLPLNTSLRASVKLLPAKSGALLIPPVPGLNAINKPLH